MITDKELDDVVARLLENEDDVLLVGRVKEDDVTRYKLKRLESSRFSEGSLKDIIRHTTNGVLTVAMPFTFHGVAFKPK